MKKLSFTLFLLLGLMTTAFAQVNPAHWKFNVKEVSNDEVELQFQLTLDNGWHIYSQKSDPNGPIPSEYTFDNSVNYKRVGGVIEPKPHEEMDDIFKCVVRSFSGKVTFRQKIKRNTDKPFDVTGSMYYQLCNDGSCIAPDDVPFTFKVPAASAPIASDVDAETSADADETVAEEPEVEKTVTVVAEISETEPATDGEKQKSLIGLFFGALLAGIVTMFTRSEERRVGKEC